MKNENLEMVKLGYAKRKFRWRLVSLILLLLTVCLAIMMMLLGNTQYSIGTVIRVLFGEEIKGATFAIATIRLPRMITGLLVGIAFGIAGNTFQVMLRNPLASPDIIGVTSGSSVAAVFCILILKMSGVAVSFMSVTAGIFVAVVIYMLARKKGFSGGRLILIGIGVQAMLNSVISYMLLKATQNDVPAAMRWLSGSLNNMQMKSIPGLFLVVMVFGMLITLLGRQLEILELGDLSATTLGLKTDKVRILLIISSVFLIAFATAVTGPIAFVAFLAGPIASKLVGQGSSNTVPAAFVGALLVLGSDLIGQFAFSIRIPVGIITGILGAPYLLILLISMNRKGKG